MHCRPLVFLLFLSAAAPLRAAALTEMETRWLRAGEPVLAAARALKLPLDIIVQPQDAPGAVPLAMGFAAGRCKLVFSMRGNPTAEATLAKVPAPDQAVMIEAMTAHELAHCWRYAQGAWHALPAGFVEVGEEQAANSQLLAEAKAMRDTRREEGYADLVALAWTRRQHPARYAQVYAWLASLRAVQPVAGGAHDTRAWVQLAREADVFTSTASAFEDAAGLWRHGLLNDH
jgi:hypothetical protein